MRLERARATEANQRQKASMTVDAETRHFVPFVPLQRNSALWGQRYEDKVLFLRQPALNQPMVDG